MIPATDSAATEAVPPVPESAAEAGLSESLIEQLILKSLYFQGEVLGRELSDTIGLKFFLIEPILESLKRAQIVTVKRSLGMGSISATLALSESGRTIARDNLETNRYAGRAPVPIEQYAAMVRAQRLKSNWLTKQMLADAYDHMVVSDDILSQIGPAVNSGRSFLIYGQPGNGKTFLAEALFRIQSSPVYIPYAVECMGQIIQVFDPVYHQPVPPIPASDSTSLLSLAAAMTTELAYDPRWIKCRRPFLVTGGELTLPMLDLSFNTASKVYDAPFQMKANNGIYLIDDFGRQKVSPAEVLNRWIVPMERRIDFLTFLTGGKAQVPFETFLVFSTNLSPEQLGDEAFLRRIQYKMFLRAPGEAEFLSIFESYCRERN